MLVFFCQIQSDHIIKTTPLPSLNPHYFLPLKFVTIIKTSVYSSATSHISEVTILKLIYTISSGTST
jgi:hypothetical protein